MSERLNDYVFIHKPFRWLSSAPEVVATRLLVWIILGGKSPLWDPHSSEIDQHHPVSCGQNLANGIRNNKSPFFDGESQAVSGQLGLVY